MINFEASKSSDKVLFKLDFLIKKIFCMVLGTQYKISRWDLDQKNYGFCIPKHACSRKFLSHQNLFGVTLKTLKTIWLKAEFIKHCVFRKLGEV